MRVVQGVIFSQPDEAMHEPWLDHRPSLYPTGPSDKDKGISNEEQGETHLSTVLAKHVL
jgi:hypothetical protein